MNSQAKESNPEAKPHALVRYDEMCRAIEAAHSLDEVLPIRDRAAQIAAAAKIAKNFEAERQCREIRVRAERRAGELLKDLPAAQGTRTDLETSPHNAEKSGALASLGVSTQDASTWERLAGVPGDEFEAAIHTSEAPSARRIIYDHVRLHGDSQRSAPEKLTGDDMANALLEGAIRDIERLENKYDNIALVKNALVSARRTIAMHLIPMPRKKGGGIHIVKS